MLTLHPKDNLTLLLIEVPEDAEMFCVDNIFKWVAYWSDTRSDSRGHVG